MKRVVVSIGAAPPEREAQRRPAGGTSPGSCASSFSNVAGRLSKARPDAVAAVVDRVVAAPQDAVVGRQAEVVELVVRVGQALAAVPSRSPPAAPASAARRRGRSRRPGTKSGSQAAQPARVGGGGDDDVRGPSSRARHRPSRSRRGRRRRPARAPSPGCLSWSARAPLAGDLAASPRASFAGSSITQSVGVARSPPSSAASEPRPAPAHRRGRWPARRGAAASSACARSSSAWSARSANVRMPVSSRSQSMP